MTNFNPHSREGSDDEMGGPLIRVSISIHTPAKGVTLINPLSSVSNSISIHTPAKGVTLLPGLQVIKSILFQSTLPRRE